MSNLKLVVGDNKSWASLCEACGIVPDATLKDVERYVVALQNVITCWQEGRYPAEADLEGLARPVERVAAPEDPDFCIHDYQLREPCDECLKSWRIRTRLYIAAIAGTDRGRLSRFIASVSDSSLRELADLAENA